MAGDTDGNIGDLAIVTATCEQLRSIDPDIQIALPTSRPDRDSRQLGIVPLQRGWRGFGSMLRWARQADLVVFGGGGLLQDDDSLVKVPYWAMRLACLRLVSRRIAGLSIGAGPLDHRISRAFAGLAMRTLSLVSVRDPLALAVLQPLTGKRVRVVPDPAFLLKPSTGDSARKLLLANHVPSGKTLVGVAVRRWFHTNSNLVPHKYGSRLGLGSNRGQARMSAFMDTLAQVLDSLVSTANAHVVFMPTYNVKHEDDAAICEAIARRMQPGSSSLLRLDDPKLYKAVTGCMAVMLCGRMHPAILAAGQGTPVVGLAYNQKFFGMFELLGQGARCLSMTELVHMGQASNLASILGETIRHPETFKPVTAGLEKTTAEFIRNLVAPPAVVHAASGSPQTQPH